MHLNTAFAGVMSEYRGDIHELMSATMADRERTVLQSISTAWMSALLNMVIPNVNPDGARG